MPDANILFAVTAVVIAGLVVWVAAALKTAKEPWARAPVEVKSSVAVEEKLEADEEKLASAEDEKKADDPKKDESKAEEEKEEPKADEKKAEASSSDATPVAADEKKDDEKKDDEKKDDEKKA